MNAEHTKDNNAAEIHVKSFKKKEIEVQKDNSQRAFSCANGCFRQELPDHSRPPAASSAEGNFWQMSDPEREKMIEHYLPRLTKIRTTSNTDDTHWGQNSPVAHVSGFLRHFIPPDTCPSAPVTADDCSFQSLLLQTAQCLKPEESLRSSGQKDRHAYLHLPRHHTELRSRREALFRSIAGISFRLPCQS